jgi:hypothetical protein
MMGTRQRLRGGIEYDALTRFRRRIRLRQSEVARAKRQFWKRTRKEARSAAEREATAPLE